MSKFWTGQEQVVKNYEKVVNESRTSNEQIGSKSWTNSQQVSQSNFSDVILVKKC